MAEERAHGSSTEIDYHRVKADPTARISPSCSLVGDVTLGKKVAVMAGSCLRGDDAPIVVEDECNIQEASSSTKITASPQRSAAIRRWGIEPCCMAALSAKTA